MKMFFVIFVFLANSNYIRGTRTIRSQVGSDITMNLTLPSETEDAIYIDHNKNKTIIVLWPKKNHSDLTNEYTNRLNVFFVKRVRGLELIFRLKNVSKLDEGLYTSYMFRDDKEIETVKLIVTGPLEEPTIKDISRQEPDSIDNKIELFCQLRKDSNGYAVWWKNESRVASGKKHVIFNNTLTIVNVEESDQYDNFVCANYVNSVRSKSYRIRLGGPDNITLAPNENIIYEFSTLNITCMATCYLSCSFQWIRHGYHVIPDILTSDSAGIHVKKNASREDAGNYSCTAKNKITKKTVVDNFTLKVIYGPDYVYFNEVQAKNSSTTAQLKIVNCSADCYPPCEYLLNGPGVVIVNSKEYMHNVTEKGAYTCRAINPASGKVSGTSLLTISHEFGHNDSRNNSAENTNDSADERTFVIDIISTPLVTKILLGTSISLTCLICGVLVCKLRKRCFKPSSNYSTAEEVGPQDHGISRDFELEHIDIDSTANYWTIEEYSTGGLHTVIDSACPTNQNRYPKNLEENVALPDVDAYLQPI